MLVFEGIPGFVGYNATAPVPDLRRNVTIAGDRASSSIVFRAEFAARGGDFVTLSNRRLSIFLLNKWARVLSLVVLTHDKAPFSVSAIPTWLWAVSLLVVWLITIKTYFMEGALWSWWIGIEAAARAR